MAEVSRGFLVVVLNVYWPWKNVPIVDDGAYFFLGKFYSNILLEQLIGRWKHHLYCLIFQYPLIFLFLLKPSNYINGYCHLLYVLVLWQYLWIVHHRTIRLYFVSWVEFVFNQLHLCSLSGTILHGIPFIFELFAVYDGCCIQEYLFVVGNNSISS